MHSPAQSHTRIVAQGHGDLGEKIWRWCGDYRRVFCRLGVISQIPAEWSPARGAEIGFDEG